MSKSIDWRQAWCKEKIKHRLYWELGQICPCVEEVSRKMAKDLGDEIDKEILRDIKRYGE